MFLKRPPSPLSPLEEGWTLATVVSFFRNILECFCPWTFCFRNLNWTCYYRTPLSRIFVLNYNFLYGGSLLCNWLSLRGSVPWINHVPPVRWYIFRKSSFERQLVCKYAVTENTPCHCFVSVCICIYTYLNVLRYNNTFFSRKRI